MSRKSFLYIMASLMVITSPLLGMPDGSAPEKASTFSVIEENRPKVALVVPVGSPEKLVKAAKDFNDTLKIAFKAELPVVQVPPKDSGAITFELKKVGLLNDDDFEISFPDKFTMKISCTELSVAWALHHLLENYADVRWVMPAETGCGLAFSGRAGWEVARQTIKDSSQFKFQRHMYRSPSKWQWENGAKIAIRNDHGLIDVAFPANKYTNNNWPEGILPVINGKKQIPMANAPGQYANYRSFWQPCFTNPESVREAVKNICSHFEKNPNAHDVSLGVNDNGGFCECEECKKLVRPSKFSNVPSHSNAYYKWCNQVVEEVTKKFPDKYFGCFAYRETMDPPDFKLHPNLVPGLCIDIYAATDPDVKKNRMAAIKEWGKKAAHTTLFEYSDPYCLPRIFFPLQEEMFKFMADNNVSGMFVENSPTLGEEPKQYLYMKQMWNPRISVQKVLDEWSEAAVGKKAAPYLKEYFNFWEKFWREDVTKTTWFNNSKNNVYMAFNFGGYIYALKDGDMAKCRRLMERVVALAETSEQKKRAELLMLFFDLYEANAIAAVAELIPVNQQAESDEQAVEILKASTKACEYLERRDKIIEKLRSIYPYLTDSNDGLGYRTDPFTSGIITSVMPFVKSPKVAAELEKIASAPDVPARLRGQAQVFQKLNGNRNSLNNLVKNGSFEEPGIPWTCNSASVRSDKFAFDGKYSREIVTRCPRIVLHSFIPIEGNSDYMFLARVFVPKKQVSIEAYLEVSAFLWKKTSPLQWYVPQPIKLIPGEWNLINAFVPGEATAMRLEVCVTLNKFENGDKVYLDDLMLFKIDKK